MTNLTKFQQLAISTKDVTMQTHPTYLVDLAMKLGIEKPGADKERLVKKVNDKLASYRKEVSYLQAARY